MISLAGEYKEQNSDGCKSRLFSILEYLFLTLLALHSGMITQIPPVIWRFRISVQHFYSFHAVSIFLSLSLYMLYITKTI